MKGWRIVFCGLLGSGAVAWLIGSILLFSAVSLPAGVCRWPFYTYAAVWPVFVALPDTGKAEFVRLSFIPCSES